MQEVIFIHTNLNIYVFVTVSIILEDGQHLLFYFFVYIFRHRSQSQAVSKGCSNDYFSMWEIFILIGNITKTKVVTVFESKDGKHGFL
jgi:hypothetical protein